MKDYTKLSTEKFNKLIFKDFPKLFEHKDNKQVSLMCFGCECGQGWNNLTYVTLKRLNLIKENNNLPDLEVTQIKEKFGGLRIYFHGAGDDAMQVTLFAEELSYITCEHCGNKGFLLNHHNWYITLCEPCYKEWVKKRVQGFTKWQLMKFKIRRWF